MIRILLFCAFLAQTIWAAPVPAYLGMTKNFVGDNNQLLGIRNALEKAAPHRFAFQTEIPLGAPSLVLLVGEDGIANATHLNTKGKVIWSGHQVFAGLMDAAKHISLVFLPAGAVEPKDETALRTITKLVLLPGVPTAVGDDEIHAAKMLYTMRIGKLPAPDPKNTLVILPGDAPDPDGKMLMFTRSDAIALAKRIVKHSGKDRIYLVTNGPRTGSVDPVSGKAFDPNPHRTGQPDKVTEAFMQALADAGARSPRLFDFQFGHMPSAYQPLLALIKEGGGVVHVPGESTSMVTECSNVLPQTIVDIVPSMNPTHRRTVDAMHAMGRVGILDDRGHFHPSHSGTQTRKTSSELAAEAILGIIP